ncbi:uncharacterized protein BYT42DRAFT_643441 [Radiomyces spectabilis]|uniref:uncharacterized protein n=1 Tax=Radiomyces spectabilis TaxID=64574 RepID=UPI00221E8F96|nr:uncharacterized protein BYT42DRAFT_643441 [Radiomyces spectabilis]KAI8384662.1 hypothetical protein BYT42DRAFT_643441 [Radiomyces spectabilis]
MLNVSCTELATTYTNLIVETFEPRLSVYLKRLVRSVLNESNRKYTNSIVEKYCYRTVCGGDPVWPDRATISEEERAAIDNICQQTNAVEMPKPVTPVSLSSNPGAYIPMLKMILSQYELKHSQHNQQEAGQDEHAALLRLFSLFPLPTFKWRYIAINPNVLAAFLGRSIPGTFEETNRWLRDRRDVVQKFFSVPKWFRFYSDLDSDVRYISREVQGAALTNISLCGLDPGRTHVFIASYGQGEERHQVRRCSTKEYYTPTGSVTC